jgi:hypothetical protein
MALAYVYFEEEPGRFSGPARGILAGTGDAEDVTSLAMCDCRAGGLPARRMDPCIEAFLTDVLALGDLLDGFVLTVLIAVAIGTIYYAIRLVKELRRFTRR